MDSLQFYPNAIMQDGDEVITYMHVNGLTPSHNQPKEGSAVILLFMFVLIYMMSRNNTRKIK